MGTQFYIKNLLPKGKDMPQLILQLVIFSILIGVPLINMEEHLQGSLTGKFVFFMYGSLLLVSLSFFSVITSKLEKISITITDLLLLLLLTYITINRYFLQPHFNFSIRYYELIGLSSLYLCLKKISFKNYFWLLIAIIISGIVQTIYGLLQFLGYLNSNHARFDITGSFFNPGPFAGFIAITGSIALSTYLFRHKIAPHLQYIDRPKSFNRAIEFLFEYIPLIGILSVLIVLPLTESRASWLALLVSSLLLIEVRYALLKTQFQKINRLKKNLTIVFLGSCFGLLLISLYFLKTASADGRLFIWKVSTSIIKEHPFFGIGFDRFKTHFMNYQANYFTTNSTSSEIILADNTYYAYNEMLQFVIENGLFGLLFCTTLFFIIYKTKTTQENKYINSFLKINLLAMVVFAFFSYPTQIVPFKIIAVVLISFITVLNKKNDLVYTFRKNQRTTRFVLKSIFLLSGVYLLFTAYTKITAIDNGYTEWKIAKDSQKFREYDLSIDEFKNILPLFAKNGAFLFSYGKCLQKAKQHENAIKIFLKTQNHLNNSSIELSLAKSYKALNLIKKAELSYKKASQMVPVKFYPKYLLAKLYHETGQTNKAIQIATEITKMKIKINSPAIKKIKKEMENLIVGQ